MFAIPKIVDEQKGSWETALKICIKYNASLAVIESEEKQLILQTFLEKSHGDFWISGQRVFNGKFRWTNNGNEIHYTNWYPGYPKENNNNCVRFEGYEGNSVNGKWFNYNCDDSGNVHVVCEFWLNN